MMPTGYPELDALAADASTRVAHPRCRRARGGGDRAPGPEERRAHRRAQARRRRCRSRSASATARGERAQGAVRSGLRRAARGARRRARRGARRRASISPCRARRAGSAPSTRSPGSWTRSSRSSAASGSPSRSGPRSRPSGTTSSRSTSRPTTRRWTCTTRSTSTRRRSTGEPAGRLLLRTHTSPVQIRTLLAVAAAGPGGDSGHGVPQRRLRRLALAGVLARSRASRWTRGSRSWTSRPR